MRIAIAVFASSLAFAAQAASLDFKGVPFGTTLDAFVAKHPTYECQGSISDGERECSAGPDVCRASARTCGPGDYEEALYAGEQASLVTAYFSNGRLEAVRIFIRPQSFDAIASAIASKYGKVTSGSDMPIRSVSGAEATSSIRVWLVGAGDRIQVWRYTTSLSIGKVVLESKARIDSEKRRDTEAAAKRAKGI